MTSDEAAEHIARARVGDRYRMADGSLWHMRGVVDDQLVLRGWSPGRGWQYRAVGPAPLAVGLYRPELDGTK